MTKILLTGGHAATPALAVAQEIRKVHPDWKLYWIGPASAMEGQEVATAAEKNLAGSGVEVLTIIAGRLKKKGNFFDIFLAYLKIPVGFFHALILLASVSPDLIVSFGGFAAFPVVFVGWLLGRKVIIHEQIVGAGLANKMSAVFAEKIAVSRSESLEFFPKAKTILVGNPQVAGIFRVKEKKHIGSPPVVYITGGSSGSQIINNAVDGILEKLLGKYIVVHQTGELNIDHFLKRKSELSKELSGKYKCFGYVNPDEVAKFFEKADIVVGRAGANTVSDVVSSARPAILIPIPWSIGDEQRKNARKAEATGLAVILEQDNLTGEALMGKIDEVSGSWTEMIKDIKSSDFDLDKDAAKRMVDLIEETLK